MTRRAERQPADPSPKAARVSPCFRPAVGADRGRHLGRLLPILTGQTPIQPTQIVVRSPAIVNGLIVLLLIGIVAYEAAGLWIARRRGRAAARLHVRIVLLFSFIAAMPAILMVVIASVTSTKGLDRWFGGAHRGDHRHLARGRSGLRQEHSRMLGLDLLAIAGEFNRVTPDINANCHGDLVLPDQPGAASRALHCPAHPPRPERHPGGDTPSDVKRRRRRRKSSSDLDSGQAGADCAGHDQPRRRGDQAHRLR